MNGSSLLEDSCDRNQEIILDQELCRCCHATGKFKNLAESCSENGEEEIFADLLRYCFNIEILPLPGKLCAVTYNICEVCIGLLRDANRFKKTVVSSEAKFKATHEGIYKKLLNGDAILVKQEVEPILVVKVENVSVEISENHSGLEVHEDNTLGDDFESPYDWDFGDAETKKETKKDKVKKSEKCENKKKDTKPRQKRDKSKKIKKEIISDVDFDSAHYLEFGEGENKIDSEDIAVNPEKYENEISKSENEKTDNSENLKEEPYKSQPVKVIRPKFFIKEEDYSLDGANFKCTRCEKMYTNYSSLRFHVKGVHYKLSKNLKCPVCNKDFKTAAPLTRHKLEEHNIDDRFKCNACKGAFNTKAQLKRHVNSFHMLGEKYRCEYCDYECFSFESLYKHKVKHKTSKDHQCKFCRKLFLRKTTKDLHERIHTGDRRKVCTVCGQAFVQKASLNYHMTKYHPEVNY